VDDVWMKYRNKEIKGALKIKVFRYMTLCQWAVILKHFKVLYCL
jgi:hypothetical protein